MTRQRFGISAALFAVATVAASCSPSSEQGDGIEVYSYNPDVLESGYVIGRLAELDGCLVILSGRSDFESEVMPSSFSRSDADMPLFRNLPQTGRDQDGFFIQIAPSSEKLRLGDRVEGTGGVIWEKKAGPDSANTILKEAHADLDMACGERIIQVRNLKRFGEPSK